MQMKAFYKVKTDRYFFNRNDGPEERVRQWVISELLSTHGVNINDIKIEVPVKVGTRTHYADIVVYKDRTPYIVIECKRQNDDNLVTALDQAISYASSNTIKASFAICTNGNEWVVRRKIEGTWEIVPEIEVARVTSQTITLSSFLVVIQSLYPIFYWLHRVIPKEYVTDFFRRVHELFFYANSFDTRGGLLSGFDNLTRVLINDPTLAEERGYGTKKMVSAFGAFMDYLTAIGFRDYRLEAEGYQNYELVSILLASFEQLAISSNGLNNEENKWLRLVTVHLQYLKNVLRAGEILDIPIAVTNEYYDFWRPFCENRLGVRLPDSFEQEELRLIQIHCDYLSEN